MAHTATTYEALITAIDTKIALLVATQEVDYTVGNVSYKAGDKIEQLRKMRESLMKEYRGLPAEAIITQQDLITEFGEDLTEYVNEGQ